MNVTTRPAVTALLLLISFAINTAGNIAAQQKRQTPAQTPAKPQAQTQTKTGPAPTFDTIVPAESYMIYGEVRGVGQLIRSNTLNDALEPILKLAGPPKEFKTIVKFLNAHADDLMTSRLLVATWQMSEKVPEVLIGIEFASTDEAAKFATPLNQMLLTVVPPLSESSDPGENAKTVKSPPKPNYHLQQTGPLVVLTPALNAAKQIKAAGKPLSEDINFRAARNRFSSEPIFVYFNLKLMERQQEETRKRDEEAHRLAVEQAKKEQTEANPESKKDKNVVDEVVETEVEMLPSGEPPIAEALPAETAKEQAQNAAVSEAITQAASALFYTESDWPDAIGLGISFEGESFDVRALLVNAPGEKSDAMPSLPFVWPLMSLLIPGPAIVPESPNILPADTDFFATMSLDLPQIYSVANKAHRNPYFIGNAGPYPALVTKGETVNEVVTEPPPFAALEKVLKINLKDDLLPLLGSEIAVRLPVTGLDILGVPRGPGAAAPPRETAIESGAKTAPVVLISLRDKEGMRTLMPKLVEALGFKGASSLASTERREDTELVSYVNLFAYAFIGNYLVLSSEPAATRHVVDSYLKHETLATNANFKAYTRWQPRPSHGQLYISPALMESYKSWIENPSTRLNDQTKAFLQRMIATPLPVTYSLSNEGFGPLHELHVPKNLVLMAIAGISNETNPTPVQRNESSAVGLMYGIASAEHQFKKDKGAGSYGTLEQLIAADVVSKEMVENSGYKFELTFTGDKFELSAVPVEYGKTGMMSYFMDETMVLRGANHNGAAASKSDPPIN